VALAVQVVVPRFAVGIIIGRNGEMIKKIQNDTGVRIQFKQGERKKSPSERNEERSTQTEKYSY